MKILVTGATGTTGWLVLQGLVAAGEDVHGLGRSDAALERIGEAGANTAAGDMASGEGLDEALTGVDRVYLVSPGDEGQAAVEGRVIEAARRAGVEGIVRPSFAGASVDSPMRIAREAFAAEELLRASSVQHTSLRAASFMQNTLGYGQTIAEQGAFYAPTSNAALASIDARDIADVAVAILRSDDVDGGILDISGPEALSNTQLAERFTEALGREVRHVEVPVEAFQETLRGYGFSEGRVEGIAELIAAQEAGDRAAVHPEGVREVLGREPRSFVEFVRDHAAAFGAGG